MMNYFLCFLFLWLSVFAQDLVETKDDNKVNGLISNITEDEFHVTTKSGAVVKIHKRDIKSVYISGRKIPFSYKSADTSTETEAKKTETKTKKKKKTRPQKPRPIKKTVKPKRSRRPTGKQPSLSGGSLDKVVMEAGNSKPDWWESESLSYPKTLDLSYPAVPVSAAWSPKENVNQFMWSIVNENPGRYRQGTKFMHFLADKFAKDNRTLARVYVQLGHCYHDLLQDWARGAYFYARSGQKGVKLANCYWQLGNVKLAKQILRSVRKDTSRYGSAIKQWSDMGDLKKAVSLADSSAKKNAAACYRAAGDALRYHKDYKKAIKYYGKCLAAKLAKEEDINSAERNKAHARESLNTLKKFEMFSLAKIPNGQYTGKAQAYNGTIKVLINVAQNKITKVLVAQHHEKQYYSSLVEMPAKIIKKQSYNVEATTGATVTAEAIKIAAAKALVSGRR